MTAWAREWRARIINPESGERGPESEEWGVAPDEEAEDGEGGEGGAVEIIAGATGTTSALAGAGTTVAAGSRATGAAGARPHRWARVTVAEWHGVLGGRRCDGSECLPDCVLPVRGKGGAHACWLCAPPAARNSQSKELRRLCDGVVGEGCEQEVLTALRDGDAAGAALTGVAAQLWHRLCAWPADAPQRRRIAATLGCGAVQQLRQSSGAWELAQNTLFLTHAQASDVEWMDQHADVPPPTARAALNELAGAPTFCAQLLERLQL